MKPITLLNFPEKSVLHVLVTPKVSKSIVTARSYLFLLTRHGVSAEQAKKLLGLSK